MLLPSEDVVLDKLILAIRGAPFQLFTSVHEDTIVEIRDNNLYPMRLMWYEAVVFLALILSYTVVLLLLSQYSKRKSKTAGQFLEGGRRLNV